MSSARFAQRLIRLGQRLARAGQTSWPAPSGKAKPSARAGKPGRTTTPGELVIGYAPTPDGHPDPGEVVWTWVPYEEEPKQGKDRPVLIIGTRGNGPRLAGLMLTSKDHDRDMAQEAHHGRHWLDVGAGGWDREHRPSEVRLDRLIDVDPTKVRREGAALDKPRFDAVIAAARKYLT